MRRLLAGLLAIGLVTGVGCGGGGDNSCADVGARIAACSGDPVEEIQAECEALLEVAVCDGSKQAVIDCVVGLTCEELAMDGADLCLDQEGCVLPPM